MPQFLEAREGLPETERGFSAQATRIDIIETPLSDAPQTLLQFEEASIKFLIPGHSFNQGHTSRLKPWAHLPKGAFYIEDGAIVAFTGSEPANKRAREDAAASQDRENRVFTSSRRQAASHRTNINTRRRSGSAKEQGGLRPTQGGKR